MRTIVSPSFRGGGLPSALACIISIPFPHHGHNTTPQATILTMHAYRAGAGATATGATVIGAIAVERRSSGIQPDAVQANTGACARADRTSRHVATRSGSRCGRPRVGSSSGMVLSGTRRSKPCRSSHAREIHLT